jgi:thiaminase/transcriptional activator TenA
VALTDRLWAEIDDVYAAILAHPFLRGLTDGTLPQEAFRHYVVQDAHYLRDYARALAVCGARAPDEDAVVMFCEHAAGAVEVERALHASFLADWGLGPGALDDLPAGPTTVAYTSYLLATCHAGSWAEAVGAVLPCYWIYARVGAELLERGSPDPLYQRWIDTYGGDEFAAIVRAVLEVADRLGASLSEARHFRATSRYEWMFWDAGLRREAWPV